MSWIMLSVGLHYASGALGRWNWESRAVTHVAPEQGRHVERERWRDRAKPALSPAAQPSASSQDKIRSHWRSRRWRTDPRVFLAFFVNSSPVSSSSPASVPCISPPRREWLFDAGTHHARDVALECSQLDHVPSVLVLLCSLLCPLSTRFRRFSSALRFLGRTVSFKPNAFTQPVD